MLLIVAGSFQRNSHDESVRYSIGQEISLTCSSYVVEWNQILAVCDRVFEKGAITDNFHWYLGFRFWYSFGWNDSEKQHRNDTPHR